MDDLFTQKHFSKYQCKKNNYVPIHLIFNEKKSCTPNVSYSPKKEIGNCNVNIYYFIFAFQDLEEFKAFLEHYTVR